MLKSRFIPLFSSWMKLFVELIKDPNWLLCCRLRNAFGSQLLKSILIDPTEKLFCSEPSLHLSSFSRLEDRDL